MDSPRGVIFWDLDGVLLDRDRSHHSDWRKELKALHAEAFYEAFKDGPHALFQEVLCGKRDVYDAMSELARQMNIPDPTVRRVLRVWHGRNTRCNHDLMDMLGALQTAGWCNVVASNQDARRAEVIRGYTWMEDRVAFWGFSCQLGVAKPSPAFYAHLAEKAGVANVPLKLMIDDTPENLTAPAAMGWHTHLYQNVEGVKAALAKLA